MMEKIKEIVVVSGKGGTGKTTISACLAEVMPNKIIVDTDVDAANLNILIKSRNFEKYDFWGRASAEIRIDQCVSCNRCIEYCRFFAIDKETGKFYVDEFSCEGCGLCQKVCPVQAIEMKESIVGQWFIADTVYGNFVYARLEPGAENAGSLVTKVKQTAREMAKERGINTLLIDGPPGIGCPVISAISGSDFALLVTEPTYSAIEDLKRISELTDHFKIKKGIVINRYDINIENTRRIEEYAIQKDIKVLAKISHSYCIMEEISKCKIPYGRCHQLKGEIENIYQYIEEELK